MRRNKLALFVHLVWATWDRLPLLTPDIERRVHRNIEAEAQGLGCAVLALNGMPDHVHMVLRYPAKVSVARLAQQIKGVSSHFVSGELQAGLGFHWQERYGAFSLSRSHVEKVVAYVKNQKRRHAEQDLRDYAERFLPDLQWLLLADCRLDLDVDQIRGPQSADFLPAGFLSRLDHHLPIAAGPLLAPPQ